MVPQDNTAKPRIKRCGFLPLLLFVLLLISPLGALSLLSSLARAEEAPVAFSLLDSTGTSVTESRLFGKYTLLSFFFTSCEGPCPAMNAKLNLFAQKMKGTPSFQIFSVSIDGGHDTPDVLREYSAKFSSSANWFFLTGKPEEVQRLSEQVFHLAADSQEKIHTTRFILLGTKGEIITTVDSTELGSLSKIEERVKNSL